MKECLRCGNKFSKLSSHLSRKKQCDAKYLDITANKMLNFYDKYYEIYREKRNEDRISENMTCKYCNKIFSKKSNKNRHEDLYCNTTFSNNINNGKIEIGNVYGEMNNNNIQNFNININSNNNTKFELNNFGNEEPISKEDFEKILDNFFTNFFKVRCTNNINDDLISNYIQKKWMDKEKNRNVYLNNVNSPFGEIYLNVWQKETLDNIINFMFQNSEKDIRNFIENNENYNDNNINKFESYLYWQANLKNLNMNKKIKTVLLNNRDKVKEIKKITK